MSGIQIERIAKAIFRAKPDCRGKPWPFDTDEGRRAYPHNPIAAVDLCFSYARAALSAAELDHHLMTQLRGVQENANVVLAAAQHRATEAEERIARLEGRLCLVCGESKPCTSSPDACTFDPSPIEAAKSFLRRATMAEAALKKATSAIGAFLAHRSRVFNAQMDGTFAARAMQLHGALDDILDAMKGALPAPAIPAEKKPMTEDDAARIGGIEPPAKL